MSRETDHKLEKERNHNSLMGVWLIVALAILILLVLPLLLRWVL